MLPNNTLLNSSCLPKTPKGCGWILGAIVLLIAVSCNSKPHTSYRPHNAETLLFWDEKSTKDTLEWMRHDEYHDMVDSGRLYIMLVRASVGLPEHAEYIRKLDSFSACVEEAYTMLYINQKKGGSK